MVSCFCSRLFSDIWSFSDHRRIFQSFRLKVLLAEYANMYHHVLLFSIRMQATASFPHLIGVIYNESEINREE